MGLLEVFDDDGNVIGKSVDRNAHFELDDGEHIAIAVIFIENNNGEFLMQKTSKKKGGLYSSTGGHVDHGETPLETIKREVKEELGINIDDEEIKDFGFLSYDMPLRYLFYLKKDINIEDIKVQEEEVEFVKYISIDDICSMIEKKEILESHGIMFKKLMDKIQN